MNKDDLKQWTRNQRTNALIKFYPTGVSREWLDKLTYNELKQYYDYHLKDEPETTAEQIAAIHAKYPGPYYGAHENRIA